MSECPTCNGGRARRVMPGKCPTCGGSGEWPTPGNMDPDVIEYCPTCGGSGETKRNQCPECGHAVTLFDGCTNGACETNKPKPTWTKTHPETPGTYWYRDNPEESGQACEVEFYSGRWAVWFFGNECTCPLDELHGEFQGPIAPVGEPGGE